MAERRMFHGAVVGSDDFLDLPVGAQALYFHMGMHADDDGFVNGPKQIMRMLQRPKKELDLLIEKGFLIELDGVMVLTHWLVSNTLKSDRLRLPRYPELAGRLFIRADRRYSLHPEGVNLLESRQTVLESKRKPKRREDKRREDNLNKDKLRQASVTDEEPPSSASLPEAHFRPRPQDEKMLKMMGGKLGKGVVMLSDEQMDDLLRQMGLDAFDKYTEKLAEFIISNDAKVNSHYNTILKWWKQDMGIAGGDGN